MLATNSPHHLFLRLKWAQSSLRQCRSWQNVVRAALADALRSFPASGCHCCKCHPLPSSLRRASHHCRTPVCLSLLCSFHSLIWQSEAMTTTSRCTQWRSGSDNGSWQRHRRRESQQAGPCLTHNVHSEIIDLNV